MLNESKEIFEGKQGVENKNLLTEVLRNSYKATIKLPQLINEDKSSDENFSHYAKLILTQISDKKDLDNSNIELQDIFKSESNKKALIIGKAGTGKSTLLEYVLHSWSNNVLWNENFDFIFRVKLKNLLSGDWAENYGGDEKRKNPAACFIHSSISSELNEEITLDDIISINKGKTLLLVDGYDEVVHLLSKKESLASKVITRILDYSNIIMTSRPNVLTSDIASKFDTKLENNGLDQSAIESYITIHFANHSIANKATSTLLLEFLQKNPTLKQMCHTPIILKILCTIWQEAQENIEKMQSELNIAHIYEQMVIYVGKRYLEKLGQDTTNISGKKVFNLPETQFLESIARDAAYSGIGKTLIDSKLIDDELSKNYKDLTLEKVHQYGLLRAESDSKKAINQPHYFIHLTFQEYFAALYLCDVIRGNNSELIKEVVNFIATNRTDPKFLGTLKFLANILSNDNSEEGMRAISIYWEALLCNVEGIVEIGNEAKVITLMHLLSASKVKGEIDQRIPELNKIISFVNEVVLKDFIAWSDQLISNNYLTSAILNYITQTLVKNSNTELKEEDPNNHENYLVLSKVLQVISCNWNKISKAIQENIYSSIVRLSKEDNWHIAQIAIKAFINILKIEVSNSEITINQDIDQHFEDILSIVIEKHKDKSFGSTASIVLTELLRLRSDDETLMKVTKGLLEVMLVEDDNDSVLITSFSKTLQFAPKIVFSNLLDLIILRTTSEEYYLKGSLFHAVTVITDALDIENNTNELNKSLDIIEFLLNHKRSYTLENFSDEARTSYLEYLNVLLLRLANNTSLVDKSLKIIAPLLNSARISNDNTTSIKKALVTNISTIIKFLVNSKNFEETYNIIKDLTITSTAKIIVLNALEQLITKNLFPQDDLQNKAWQLFNQIILDDDIDENLENQQNIVKVIIDCLIAIIQNFDNMYLQKEAIQKFNMFLQNNDQELVKYCILKFDNLPDGFERLNNLLAEGQDSNLKIAAIEALSKILAKNDNSLANQSFQMIKHLLNDPEIEVKTLAIKSLIHILSKTEKFNVAYLNEFLTICLEDNNEQLVTSVIEILPYMTNDNANYYIDKLKTFIAQNNYVKVSATSLIKIANNNKDLGLIIQTLKFCAEHHNNDIKLVAAELISILFQQDISKDFYTEIIQIVESLLSNNNEDLTYAVTASIESLIQSKIQINLDHFIGVFENLIMQRNNIDIQITYKSIALSYLTDLAEQINDFAIINRIFSLLRPIAKDEYNQEKLCQVLKNMSLIKLVDIYQNDDSAIIREGAQKILSDKLNEYRIDGIDNDVINILLKIVTNKNIANIDEKEQDFIKFALELLYKMLEIIDDSTIDYFNVNFNYLVNLSSETNEFFKGVIHKILEFAIVTESAINFISNCFKQYNTTLVITKENKVFFEGKSYNFIKASDIENIALSCMRQIKSDRLEIKYLEDKRSVTQKVAQDYANLSSLTKIDIPLTPHKMQISLMHLAKIQSDKVELEDIFVLAETRDIFGNTVLYKISSDGAITKQVKPDELTTEFRTSIFGSMDYDVKAGTKFKYYSTSFSVNIDQGKQLIELLKKETDFKNTGEEQKAQPCTEVRKLFTKILLNFFTKDNILDSSVESLTKEWDDYTQDSAVEILTKDRLLSLKSQDARRDSVIIDTKTEVDALKDIISKLDLELLEKVFDKERLSEKENEDIRKIEKNPVALEFYHYLVLNLNALYSATSVISTGMVANQHRGVVGTIGKILNGLGDHAPIVGAGIKLLGHSLSKIDDVNQRAKFKFFTEIVENSEKMSSLSAKIARSIALDISMKDIRNTQLSKKEKAAAILSGNDRSDHGLDEPIELNEFTPLITVVDTALTKRVKAVKKLQSSGKHTIEEYYKTFVKGYVNNPGELYALKVARYIFNQITDLKITRDNIMASKLSSEGYYDKLAEIIIASVKEHFSTIYEEPIESKNEVKEISDVLPISELKSIKPKLEDLLSSKVAIFSQNIVSQVKQKLSCQKINIDDEKQFITIFSNVLKNKLQHNNTLLPLLDNKSFVELISQELIDQKIIKITGFFKHQLIINNGTENFIKDIITTAVMKEKYQATSHIADNIEYHAPKEPDTEHKVELGGENNQDS